MQFFLRFSEVFPIQQHFSLSFCQLLYYCLSFRPRPFFIFKFFLWKPEYSMVLQHYLQQISQFIKNRITFSLSESPLIPSCIITLNSFSLYTDPYISVLHISLLCVYSESCTFHTFLYYAKYFILRLQYVHVAIFIIIHSLSLLLLDIASCINLCSSAFFSFNLFMNV
jgi:hypothetical protein